MLCHGIFVGGTDISVRAHTGRNACATRFISCDRALEPGQVDPPN